MPCMAVPVARMQAAMRDYLAEAWAKRKPSAVVKSPEETLVLASMVEKETGKASERREVAGVMSNRLKIGMKLGIDATTKIGTETGREWGREMHLDPAHVARAEALLAKVLA